MCFLIERSRLLRRGAQALIRRRCLTLFVALFGAIVGIALQVAGGHTDGAAAEAALGSIFDALMPTLIPVGAR